jgi:PPOX class probable F420-dependent enzyme
MSTFVRAVTGLLGLIAAAVGVWALGWPAAFSDTVDFAPNQHFVHDVGAFQLGIGATLVLALIWADAAACALAGYVIAGVAHTTVHAVDADLGGSPAQTWLIGLSSLLAAAALVARWRELGGVLGPVDAAPAPAWAALTRQKTICLTTYRRDGTPVATPVSIAVDGERAYVRSFERAGKTRRIRRNPMVTVAPCTVRGTPTGPAIEAVAHRLTAPGDRPAVRALTRKYPLLHGVVVPLSHRLGRARTGRTVHFVLTPRGPHGAALASRAATAAQE